MGRKIDYRRFSAYLLFSFLILNNTFAQENRNNIGIFALNLKVGGYYGKNSEGFTGGIEISAEKNNLIYSADFYRCLEFNNYISSPTDHFTNIGIMIGKYKGNKYLRFQYEAGLGSFWGLKRTNLIKETEGGFARDKYDSEQFFTIGLITKLGFKIIPFQFLSIGFDLQTNINIEKPVFMLMYSLEFGDLRKKINKP